MTAHPMSESAKDREREALAKRLINECGGRCTSEGEWTVWPDKAADFILAERAKREGPLVEALERIAGRQWHSSAIDDAASALRAYRALSEPPVRTVEEVAADVVREGRLRGEMRLDGTHNYHIAAALVDELRASLAAREREGK